MSSTAISIYTPSTSGIMTSSTVPPEPTEKSPSNYNYSNFIIIIIILTGNGGLIGGVVAVVAVVVVITTVVVVVCVLKKKNRPDTPNIHVGQNVEVCKTVIM